MYIAKSKPITLDVVAAFNGIARWDITQGCWVYRQDRMCRGAVDYVLVPANTPIASLSRNGYNRICIDKATYLLHRLAYCSYHNVEMDSDVILDHIDGNRTNNSKENLRISNASYNCHNRRKSPNTSSKYYGVAYFKRDNNWEARIRIPTKGRGKKLFLGRYKSEDDAALAYNTKAKELYGDVAKLNVIGH